MPLLNRETLRNLFARGSRPTERHFADLIEATANKVDDGFSVSQEDGLCLAPLDNHKNLVSIFRSTRDREAAFTISLNPAPKINGLEFSSQSKHPQLFFKQGGNIGIHTHTPTFPLEVGGYVGMRGRVGTYASGQVPADSYWHPIISGLDGLNAFEVAASATKPASRHRKWNKIHLSLGKEDKLRRRDIVRFFTKELKLKRIQLGRIRIYDTYSLVNIVHPSPLKPGWELIKDLEIRKGFLFASEITQKEVKASNLGLKWERIHLSLGKRDQIRRKDIIKFLKGHVNVEEISHIRRKDFYSIVYIDHSQRSRSAWPLKGKVEIKEAWWKMGRDRENKQAQNEIPVEARLLHPDEMRPSPRGGFIKGIALAAFERRGAHNKIRIQHSGRLWDRILLRWVPIEENLSLKEEEENMGWFRQLMIRWGIIDNIKKGNSRKYELQIRTLLSYGFEDKEGVNPFMINYQVGQLWSDTLTLNERDE